LPAQAARETANSAVSAAIHHLFITAFPFRWIFPEISCLIRHNSGKWLGITSLPVYVMGQRERCACRG
ncbi:MAG: hypothetical protein KDD83_21265, partial [Caldilineaceae bacterium]|nr:hypothetical protein [Caldilineaceae bacterium]